MNIFVQILAEEVRYLKNDLMKSHKTKEMLEKRLRASEAERDAVIADREKLRVTIGNMEREVQGAKKGADADKRDLENCAREKDILNKNILRHQGIFQVIRIVSFTIVLYFSNDARSFKIN